MIKRKGDLFSSTADALGQGVNCLGLMGAGIALPFSKKYPDMYAHYKETCDARGLLPGGVHLYLADEARVTPYLQGKRLIVNMASQNKPGADASYEWLFESGMAAAAAVQNLGLRKLAIPLIGCGIGGLEWEKAEVVLGAVEVLNSGFQFEVWRYE